MRRCVLLGLLIGLIAYWLHPEPVVSGAGGVVFPLSIKGKTYQPDVFLGPGVKGPVGKLNDKKIAEVLQGILPDFATPYLDLDPSGRFFVYFNGRDDTGFAEVRVATNPNGADTTSINTLITSDGFFWGDGEYELPVLGERCPINMTGKITWQKGTFVPKKMSGVFNLLCFGIGETFMVKFKTLKPVT